MPAEYPVAYLFTGNPNRTSGYGFIAGSQGAQDWTQHCLSRATLGGASESPDLWRAASDFEGIGSVWIGEVLCFTRLQQLRGDQHLAEIRQHILLPLEATFALNGDLKPLRERLRPIKDYAAIQALRASQDSLPEMRLAARDQLDVQALSYRALSRWFPEGRALPMLLQSLFDGKGAVCLRGLPRDTAQRLDFALALMALLPPPLRFACTFATRVISSRGCFAHFKFLWEDYQAPEQGERLFDYPDGAFAVEGEPAPYFRHALQAYRDGEEAFREFGERYRQRTIELQRFNLKRFQSDFLKATYYTLLALDEWIEQEKSPSAARLLKLINKDKSLPEADLPRLYQEGLRLAFSAYTRPPYPPEVIEHSAAALERPALAEVALKWLKNGALEQPEATFELCRAWWQLPTAQALLQDDVWQAMLRKAARTHLSQLLRRGEYAKAHQFFNRLYRESADRTGFVLDEQTALELLKIQEDAIGQHGGDRAEVLETLRWSLRERSTAELDSTLNENWLRALPTDLALALKPASQQGDLGLAARAHFSADATLAFYKLALLCLKRQSFQPLLTEASLALLLRQTEPCERDLTYFYALRDLTEQQQPQIAYIILSQLADQRHLIAPLSAPHLQLTAWLIASGNPRATLFIQQGISQAETACQFIKQLLMAYKPYRQSGLPRLWEALRSAKPVAQDADPCERVDFALLTELTDEEWYQVPSLVSSVASGLATRQEPPNALERALQDRKRLSGLQNWYTNLLQKHPNHPSVIANAQRVFAGCLRDTAADLYAEKPNVDRAVESARHPLRRAPERSAFQTWVVDSLSEMLSALEEQERVKVRNDFIDKLQREGFDSISQLLLESALRRRLLPVGWTPERFFAALDTTLRVLDQLVVWQEELNGHPETTRRLLNEWFERGQPTLPPNSQLPTYFLEGYNETLSSIRDLAESGQRDVQHLLLGRERRLQELRKGEREPSSVFGLLLRWLGRLVSPQRRTE